MSHIFSLYFLKGVGKPLFHEKCQNFKSVFYLVGMKMRLFTVFVSDFKSDEALFCSEDIHLGFEMVLFCVMDI